MTTPTPTFSIRLDVHVHHHDDNRLDEVLALLRDLQTKGAHMSAELDALTAQVQANTDTEQSAITLLQGLGAQIEALKNDPAALTALSAKLKTSADALAAAIVANTPAAPAPPATPAA